MIHLLLFLSCWLADTPKPATQPKTQPKTPPKTKPKQPTKTKPNPGDKTPQWLKASRGLMVGSWIFDKNATEAQARKILPKNRLNLFLPRLESQTQTLMFTADGYFTDATALPEKVEDRQKFHLVSDWKQRLFFVVGNGRYAGYPMSITKNQFTIYWRADQEMEALIYSRTTPMPKVRMVHDRTGFEKWYLAKRKPLVGDWLLDRELSRVWIEAECPEALRADIRKKLDERRELRTSISMDFESSIGDARMRPSTLALGDNDTAMLLIGGGSMPGFQIHRKGPNLVVRRESKVVDTPVAVMKRQKGSAAGGKKESDGKPKKPKKTNKPGRS